MTVVSDRRSLRAARSVIAHRGGRRGGGDIAYLAYSAVMVAVIVGFPVLRFAVLGLAAPAVQDLIRAPAAIGIVTLAGSILVSGAILLGPIRGPAMPSPFLVQFLLGSSIARRISLTRPFLVASAVLVVLFGGAAGLVAIAHGVSAASAGAPGTPLADVLLIASALAFSVLLSIAWLVGQSAPRSITGAVAAVILITGVLAALGPPGVGGVGAFVTTVTPWGWLALSWQDVSALAPTTWPTAALALSLVTMAAVPALLDAVSVPGVLAQSIRWKATSTLLTTGDAAAAIGGFRPPPHRARRLAIPFRGPMAFAVFTRDSFAILRFPARLIAGVVGLLVAGALIGICATAPGGIRWVIALPAALLAYFAVGVWCDGLRDSCANATGSSLYGWDVTPRTAAHALAPLVAALVLGGAGVILAGGAAASVVWWVLLAAFTVVVRVYDSAKGPLPLLLLMPILTPVGDVSVINVLLWQSDAVLLALAVGGGLSLAAFSGPSGAVAAPVWLVVGGIVVALLALRRIRVLGRPT